MTAQVQMFYHFDTHTLSYIVFDRPGGQAVIIDSVLDFSANAGRVWTEFADQQIQYLKEKELTLVWILETHAHADHLSAAQYIKHQCGGKIAIGAGIEKVQKHFYQTLNMLGLEPGSEAQPFDHLFNDGDQFKFGELEGKVLATPGHTQDSLTYLIGNNAFVGDTLFMPDGGTARCDFPGGDSKVLYQSINALHALPDETQIWVCHDYQPEGRDVRYVTTVAESRKKNIHVRDGVTEEEFVHLRTARDATLDVPNLLYPSIQVNIRAGKMPNEEAKGKRFIKIPLELPSDWTEPQ